MDKLKLEEVCKVEDGTLLASVGRTFTSVVWKSDKKQGPIEELVWTYTSLPTATVKEFDRSTGLYEHLDKRPDTLMKYREMFEGINKNVDIALKMYDSGAFYNGAFDPMDPRQPSPLPEDFYD